MLCCKSLALKKFFGVKNGAAFENALETALKSGLSSKDAVILATAKAQGTALPTQDKAVIAVANQIGVTIK